MPSISSGPAAVQRRAVLERVVDEQPQALEPLARDERADLRRRVGGVADAQRRAAARRPRRGSGRRTLCRQIARPTLPPDCPALANAAHAAPRAARRDVGVGEHEHRVVAAELEHAALERPRAGLADRDAGAAPAGEAHLGDGRLDERAAGRGVSVDDAQQPLGQPGAREDRARSARRRARRAARASARRRCPPSARPRRRRAASRTARRRGRSRRSRRAARRSSARA